MKKEFQILILQSKNNINLHDQHVNLSLYTFVYKGSIEGRFESIRSVLSTIHGLSVAWPSLFTISDGDLILFDSRYYIYKFERFEQAIII